MMSAVRLRLMQSQVCLQDYQLQETHVWGVPHLHKSLGLLRPGANQDSMSAEVQGSMHS